MENNFIDDVKRKSAELQKTMENPRISSKAELLRMFSFAANYSSYLHDKVLNSGCENLVVFPDFQAHPDPQRLAALLFTKPTEEVEEVTSDIIRRFKAEVGDFTPPEAETRIKEYNKR